MLSERERTVIFLRFGFNDHGKHTLQEIGDKFKVTRECIRLTEKRDLQRIRTDDQTSHLQCYLSCGV
jgi:RNA polymerase primary sigma factor